MKNSISQWSSNDVFHTHVIVVVHVLWSLQAMSGSVLQLYIDFGFSHSTYLSNGVTFWTCLTYSEYHGRIRTDFVHFWSFHFDLSRLRRCRRKFDVLSLTFNERRNKGHSLNVFFLPSDKNVAIGNTIGSQRIEIEEIKMGYNQHIMTKFKSKVMLRKFHL